MESPKTFFITGATGNQGGAVARNLIKKGYKVKALTRRPSSAASLELIKLRAEIIQGDLDRPSSYKDHLKGVDGIFSVQVFTEGVKKEIQQGIQIANLAKEYEVPLFIYSSVSGSDRQTGIPHWESKFQIESHIRHTGIPYTILRPTSLYQNFLIPPVYKRLLKGKLATPLHKSTIQQFTAAEDIGNIVATIASAPAKYRERTITIAAEQMNSEELAALFSDTLSKEIKHQQMPSFITRLALGKNLYQMFQWLNKNDTVFVKDLQEFKTEFPGLMSLRDWIKAHFVKP